MESDTWLVLAIFCFAMEAVIRIVSFRNAEAGQYGGILTPIGLAFFATSFLSFVTSPA